MKQIDILEPISGIGESAFLGCSSVTVVNLPATLTSIQASGFEGCKSLTSIAIPNSVTLIGAYAFSECSLGGSLVIPEQLTLLDKYSFQKTQIAGVSWNNLHNLTVTAYVFLSVSTLLSVDFGDASITITSFAFYSLKITSLYIGKNTYLWSNYFCDSTQLAEIVVSPDHPFLMSEDNVVYFRDRSQVVIYPPPRAANYTAPASVTVIGPHSFRFAMSEHVVLPEVTKLLTYAFFTSQAKTVSAPKLDVVEIKAFESSKIERVDFPVIRTIGTTAFSGCSKLKSITIPNTIVSIESAAFSNCPSLVLNLPPDHPSFVKDTTNDIIYLIDHTKFIFIPYYTSSIVVPRNMTTIYLGSFRGLINLSNVSYEGEVTSFGSQCFENLPNYKHLFFPASAEKFGDNQCTNSKFESVTFGDDSKITVLTGRFFFGCSELRTVNFGRNSIIQTIESSAFFGCKKLESIDLPETLTAISSAAFEGCSGMKSLALRGVNLSIHYTAFSGCVGLVSIVADTGIISPVAFRGLKNLETVEFTAKVTNIGTSSFSGCEKLRTIAFTGESSLSLIGANAFESCHSLVRVSLPGSVETDTVKASIFSRCNNLVHVEVEDNTRFITNTDGVLYLLGYGTLILCPSGLMEIFVRNETTNLGSYAFSGCSKLTSIYLSHGLTNISSFSFFECSSLLQLNIPKSIKYIGETPFKDCTKLNLIFYCGTSDYGMSSFENKDQFPPNVRFFVNDDYLNSTFLNKVVLKSSSVDNFGCPNVPTNVFTFGKRKRLIPRNLFVAHFALFFIKTHSMRV